MSQNPFILAADNSPLLLPLLRQDASIASAQDEHGYSLLHAAASYNHLDLLRALVLEFSVDINLQDEDEETALFVVETREAARVLVEELGINTNHKGTEGLTAREKILSQGEFPAVSTYLAGIEAENLRAQDAALADGYCGKPSPRLPAGMEVTFGRFDPLEAIPDEIDLDFHRRIEELAQRTDFDGSSGQAALRKIVEDALVDQKLAEERNVRPKQV